jgi:PAS domain-containing protein
MSEPTEVGHRRAAPKGEAGGLLDLAMVAPVAMAAVSLDKTVLAVNERFTRLFGYVREDVPTLASCWARAFPDPSYRSEMAAGWELLVGGAREGREIGPVERRITSKSGEELPASSVTGSA